ncbi:MAB_1171c family putative transporter [Streptomyces sp. TRM 70351]|uniref:MAB_1171c family putative transporter n=1 Tax=Streptomyces sp. TRM 70351 TaxID=3116552 RepID=UPI002E7B64C5|nr:MAB_1171c family putative transporter [Streptomyces sp. TRM 70351]MEE1929529.1 MAB_1171c family putative transporter [Streptomyces sp. TRM 70351]
METAVLVLLWCVVLWRAPAAARVPRQRALWLTFAALTVSMTLRLPEVMRAIDGGTGVNNLSTLLKHLIGITAAAALLEFVFGVTRPGRDRGRRLRIAAAGATWAALAVLFALVPRTAEAEEFFETNAGSGAATAYLMVWYAYLGLAMAVAALLFWSAARHARAGWLRAGLCFLGAGTAAGVGYALVRAVYLVLRLAGTVGAGADPGVTHSTDVMKHAAIVLILVGTTLPAVGVAWRAAGHWRDLRRLDPLWRHLTAAVPEVVLHEELGRGELRMRLHRRVVEIRDALLALQPYLGAEEYERADAVAAGSGLTGSARRALADACWVEAAREAKLAGHPPAPAGRRPEAGPDAGPDAFEADLGDLGNLSDLDAEAAWLRALETARHRPAVRAFTAAPRPRESTPPQESTSP